VNLMWSAKLGAEVGGVSTGNFFRYVVRIDKSLDFPVVSCLGDACMIS